jgi:leader peptidase (prepilin peptidase)/N-methyltransferase
MSVTPETILFVGWILFGAIVGSFLNAFIYRVPRRISLVSRTRSFCPACEAVIRWYDNIPVLSYLALRGKCRDCRAPIPVRYLLVELITTGLFAWAFHAGMNGPELGGVKSVDAWVYVLAVSFVCADLVALSFVDIETYTVPVVNTGALILLGLALAPLWPELVHAPTVWAGGLEAGRLDAALNSVEGAILGGGLVWAVGAAAELVIRKESMGSGDVKILAGVGALLGWKSAVLSLFMATLIGAVTGILTLVVGASLARRAEKRRKRVWGGTDEKKKGITYRYEEDEEAPPADEDVVKSRRLMVTGFVLALVQVAALFALPGAKASSLAAAPFYFGATIGFFMVFYDVVRRRLVHEGRWIRREISKSEDGSTEERLTGHYLPFGPFLAIAAVVMVFFGRGIVAMAARHLFGVS